MAITSPVWTSSTMPVADFALNAIIALPSSLSIAACTRLSIDRLTGVPRVEGLVSWSSKARSIPARPMIRLSSPVGPI